MKKGNPVFVVDVLDCFFFTLVSFLLVHFFFGDVIIIPCAGIIESYVYIVAQ